MTIHQSDVEWKGLRFSAPLQVPANFPIHRAEGGLTPIL